MPLPAFIRHLYFKRFGKGRPDVVLSIEEKVASDYAKKLRQREARLPRRSAAGEPVNPPATDGIA